MRESDDSLPVKPNDPVTEYSDGSISANGRSGLLRAMKIVMLLADRAPEWLGVSAISRETGIPKAVAHRMLKELTGINFLYFDKGEKRYGLGSLAVVIGLSAMRGMDINRVARPHLERLTAETLETATLSILDGASRSYVHQVRSPQEISMSVTLGVRYPLYAGASSKAILADFTEGEIDDYFSHIALTSLTAETIIDEAQLREEFALIRSRGYAVSLGERQAGAASVAAAVHSADGRVCGSISVSGPLGRFPPSVQDRYGHLVKETAFLVSTELGYRPGKS